MKTYKMIIVSLSLIVAMLLYSCSIDDNSILDNNLERYEEMTELEKTNGSIYLYGEQHGEKGILDEEIKIWGDYYDNHGMRHLFVELPYYTAEFLNIWMQDDSDDIFNMLYENSEGTAWHNQSIKDFYYSIKKEYPETLFHGTDVGHQYHSIGVMFLEYLNENMLMESYQYAVTKETIKQGEYFYKNAKNIDHVYRENKMVENFIREFDNLNDENIMGIYGSAHTELDAKNFTNEVAGMATQLNDYYGNIITSINLQSHIEFIRKDTMMIGGKEYVGQYYGKEDITGVKDYSFRELWLVENSYDDFSDNKKTGDVLPNNNYPIEVQIHQVFVIDYTKTDGSVSRTYYRSDGNEWKGRMTTEQFKVEWYSTII